MGGSFIVCLHIILPLCSVLGSSSLDAGSTCQSGLRICDKIKISDFLTDSYERLFWPDLTTAAVHLFNGQIMPEPVGHYRSEGSFFLVLFQMSTMKPASVFINNVSVIMEHVQSISFRLDDKQVISPSIERIINVFIDNRNSIITVVMFIEDNILLDKLLNEVSNTRDLLLSGVIHTTEWMIVSSNNETFSYLQEKKPNIDFITLIFQCSLTVICAVQKSRNEIFSNTTTILYKIGLRNKGLPGIHKFCAAKKLRKHALVFLESHKSILSGMKLGIGWIASEYTRLARLNKTGNVTTSEGFSSSLLKLLATYLGFGFDFVTVKNGEDYGDVKGLNASGLIGMLKRREVALTTLPITRTRNRLPLIECVPVMIFRDSLFLIYRVAENVNEMDLIYTSIFQPAFLYSLIGPVLALALIGAFVHVATQSCSTKHPVLLSSFEARHLLTFPEHICFHGTMTYPGQTGRVLRATWSILWFIMCSSYAAFLATEFTVKPPEDPINTFQKLSDANDYKMGIVLSHSAFFDMYFNSDNTTIEEIRNKLVKQNTTDGITFNARLETHANKVLGGHYVFVSGFCISLGACDDIFNEYWDDIRVYRMNVHYLPDSAFMATPKHTFYDRELYKVLLHLEEMGIIIYLRNFHFKPRLQGKHKSNDINKGNRVVTLSRVLLPVYMLIVGVGVSVTCLVLEVMYNRWKPI